MISSITLPNTSKVDDAHQGAQKSDLDDSESESDKAISFETEDLHVDADIDASENAKVSAEVLPLAERKQEFEPQSSAENATLDPIDDEKHCEIVAQPPLSAASMWREIARYEGTSSDPEKLLNMFGAFLEEFDQIAAEHQVRVMRDALGSIPGVEARSDAEWHVL
jgi:hypothetical protein